MTSAEHISNCTNSPNIFFHDSDDQVLAWFHHAQKMINIEGRWQQVWKIFACAATEECQRRKLCP